MAKETVIHRKGFWSPVRPSGQASLPRRSLLPSAASKRLLPWLVAVAFFMESLDTTILNMSQQNDARLTCRLLNRPRSTRL